MYITDEAREEAIRAEFKQFAARHADQTFQFGGSFHWGKIDLAFHEGHVRLEALRTQMQSRYDVRAFMKARSMLDPKGILSNRLVETVFKH